MSMLLPSAVMAAFQLFDFVHGIGFFPSDERCSCLERVDRSTDFFLCDPITSETGFQILGYVAMLQDRQNH